jgi:putative membrane protein
LTTSNKTIHHFNTSRDERMRPLKHLLINIIVNGAVLYAIVHYVPELGFKITSIYKDTYIIFGILGIVFWLINSVLKNILKILTLPIRVFTLGLFSLIINLGVLYIFEQTVNYLDVGIGVQLGTIIQTAILSIILSAIYFLIKKII